MWTTSVSHKQICDHFYGSVWPTGHVTSVVMRDFWHALLPILYATSLLLNLAICPRYMIAWNYTRTDTMPISYTIIMIRSAVAKFPPEYSDRNLTGKTQCVKQMWLSGNCRASPVVSVSSKTRHAWLIQSSLQHGRVLAVFLYALFLLYLSLSLSLILTPQKSAYYLTFSLDT